MYFCGSIGSYYFEHFPAISYVCLFSFVLFSVYICRLLSLIRYICWGHFWVYTREGSLLRGAKVVMHNNRKPAQYINLHFHMKIYKSKLCEIGGDSFWPRHFSEEAQFQKKNYRGTRTVTEDFKQGPKQRWCKAINIINNFYFSDKYFRLHFKCIFLRKCYQLRYFSSICVIIPEWPFWSI